MNISHCRLQIAAINMDSQKRRLSEYRQRREHLLYSYTTALAFAN